NFTFTEEQRLLEDTVRRFIARDYTFEQRRKILASEPGWSRDVWRTFAELGLLGLNVPEDHGGLNASTVETMLVMNALGEGMVVEPFLGSAVLATRLLSLAASTEQQAKWFPALVAGESIAAVAHAEPGSRYELSCVETRAVRDGTRYRLNGRKSAVIGGAAADVFLVSARTTGDAGAETGISLFLIERGAPGVSVNDYATIDARREAEIRLQDVTLPASARLGAEGDAYRAIEQAYDFALAAHCADGVGAMKALLDATVEYLRTHKQFGQPIGRFQALQHRAVDMLMHYEQAKSMSYYAAVHSSNEDRNERRAALSAAKVMVGRAARFISQQAVQLHGAMGMTDELNVSHYFKRLTATEIAFGDMDSHLEQFVGTMRANETSVGEPWDKEQKRLYAGK
ncbi:MAG: acyl-CoA dehydrogenase family protein, partial [Sulfurifustaceae bacterium]